MLMHLFVAAKIDYSPDIPALRIVTEISYTTTQLAFIKTLNTLEQNYKEIVLIISWRHIQKLRILCIKTMLYVV